MEKAKIDRDKIGRAVVRFSKSARAEEIFQDVLDGIRTKISVGYMVHDVVLESRSDEEGSTYRVMSWEPLEISSVSIPADVSVGVGRSAPPVGAGEKTQPESKASDAGGEAKADELTNGTRSITQKGTGNMDEKNKDQQGSQEPRISSEETRKQERERIAEIHGVASRFVGRVEKIDELRDKAITAGTSVSEFKGEVLMRISDKAPVEPPASEVGLSGKETEAYSITRAIAAMIPGSGVKAELEMEASREIAKNLKKSPQGFYIPWEVQNKKARKAPAMEQRTVMVAGTGSLGGNLVGTVHADGSFIDIYINKMLMLGLGVMRLPGLVGDVAIPKKTAHGTAYWVTEDAAPTVTNMTVGQIVLQPKTVGAYSDFSRQLLLQSLPSIDSLVMTDLMESVALAVDSAILNGSGSAGQPTGIINWPSLTSVSDATFTWAKAVAHETAVKNANADRGTMAFLTTPSVVGSLKTREKASGYPVYVMDDAGRMAGYPVYDTLQMPSANLLFGSFSQVILGEWGIIDVTVDPYTNSTKGTTRVVVFQSVDVGVRQIGAFHLGTSFS